KPLSFNGAVGQFNFSAKLLSSPKVKVGDTMKLLLEVSGQGQLENVLPPDLCCQAGFSGLFKTSDLPPQTEMKENTKSFIVEIAPLFPTIDSIPPIAFSYFDPSFNQYQTIITPGIPIQVQPLEKKAPVQQAEEEKKAAFQPASEKETFFD